MARTDKRTVDGPGTGKKEGQGGQNRIADVVLDAGEMDGKIVPLLVDANQGARMLGISVSHFYKFMRKNQCAPPVTIGSLRMWRRNDLVQFTGQPQKRHSYPDDVLIDAKIVAQLCSVSRSMVYKLNDCGLMPEPIMNGRTLRWSFQVMEEWVEAGCPGRDRKRR